MKSRKFITLNSREVELLAPRQSLRSLLRQVARKNVIAAHDDGCDDYGGWAPEEEVEAEMQRMLRHDDGEGRVWEKWYFLKHDEWLRMGDGAPDPRVRIDIDDVREWKGRESVGSDLPKEFDEWLEKLGESIGMAEAIANAGSGI